MHEFEPRTLETKQRLTERYLGTECWEFQWTCGHSVKKKRKKRKNLSEYGDSLHMTCWFVMRHPEVWVQTGLNLDEKLFFLVRHQLSISV